MSLWAVRIWNKKAVWSDDRAELRGFWRRLQERESGLNLIYASVISERVRKGLQHVRGGHGFFSASLGELLLMHKQCQICSEPRMTLCLSRTGLDRLTHFKGRIWRPCNKFLLSTLVPSWDHWISSSWNSFLCPRKCHSCHWNSFSMPQMLMKG